MSEYNEKIEGLKEQQEQAKKFFEEKKLEMEQAKEIFLKLQGAIEILTSMEEQKEEKAKEKKESKK
jgi:hypothetical protein|tara:strand:- start:212 stop:409 length:198 start_codon:yes stop_codon:yes gene_type:complete